VTGDISSLNEAVVSEDAEKIQEALERLKNSSMEIGKAIYSQGDSQGESQGDDQSQADEQQSQEEDKTEEAEKTSEQQDGEQKK
jgi:hypothetical protein